MGAMLAKVRSDLCLSAFLPVLDHVFSAPCRLSVICSLLFALCFRLPALCTLYPVYWLCTACASAVCFLLSAVCFLPSALCSLHPAPLHPASLHPASLLSVLCSLLFAPCSLLSAPCRLSVLPRPQTCAVCSLLSALSTLSPLRPHTSDHLSRDLIVTGRKGI